MTRISADSIIKRTWLVEYFLLQLIMPDLVTTADLQDNDDLVCAYLDLAPSRMHLIADARPLRVYPSLSDFLALRVPKHPKLGWYLTVGVEKQPLLRFFLKTITNAAQIHHRDFETLSEAAAFARTLDTALADLDLED